MNFFDRHPYITIGLFVLAVVFFVMAVEVQYCHSMGYETVFDRLWKSF